MKFLNVEGKEYALETVYNVYYDMYMSEAKALSKVVAKMKSDFASYYVGAVTKRKIITKEEAEKQREAAFEDVRKHMQKEGGKRKSKKDYGEYKRGNKS